MRFKMNAVVVLVVALAAFVAPTAISGQSQLSVVKFGHDTSKPGPRLPIIAPQDIGPVCPPGVACANRLLVHTPQAGPGPACPPGVECAR